MQLPTLFTRHADDRVLLQYIDDDPRLGNAMRAHIDACAECGVALDELRALHDRARSLPAPELSEAILARIQTRVSAGESVILPGGHTTDGARSDAARRLGTPRGRLVVIAIAASAMLAIWLPRLGTEAQAGNTSGDLRFFPAAPRPGDWVIVEYRASAMLQAEPRLTLRARLRTEWNDSYAKGIPIATVAGLRRGRDGLYRGGFRLPRDVVYGVFAVEDIAARRVDSRNRRLWELLVADTAGRPLYDALRQREHELIGRNSTIAFETVRERVALDPDAPAARSTMRSFETISLGADADSALPEHKKEWWRLHRLWSARADVPFAVVDGMLSYAVNIVEDNDSIWTTAREVWKPRRDSLLLVQRTDRAGADARWGRLNSLALRARGDSTKRDSAAIVLAEAERYWATTASRAAMAPTFGFQIAAVVRDSTAAQLRWADRLVQRIPEQAYWRYGQLARTPTLNAVARQRLLARIESLRRPDDSRRPLELSRAEALRADSAAIREILGALADAELLAGDTVRARTTLARATSSGWSSVLFRRAAQVLWSAGDRRAATSLMAHIVVDPGTPSSEVDSLTTLARGAVPDSVWRRAVERSRFRMRDHFLATAISAPLPGPIPLRSASGATSLAAIAGPRPSVIVYWSRSCGPSRDQMAALDSLSAQLGRLGAALVPVTREPITEDVMEFLREKKVTVPVYVDGTGAAQRAFDQWSWPEYYVVDANGVMRYRHSSLDLVLAQVAALRAQNERPLVP